MDGDAENMLLMTSMAAGDDEDDWFR
jgi:hypothetical protein